MTAASSVAFLRCFFKTARASKSAVSGFEAAERAKTPRPDLVLLELAMLKMNGAEAASIMKKMMPNMPIIVFTMFSDNLGRSLAPAIGVAMVRSKPDRRRALVEATESLLDPRQWPGDLNPH